MRERDSYLQKIAASSDPGNEPRQQPSVSRTDGELLDAYSQAVVDVVDRVAPAVVHVFGKGRGAGSGFLISDEGHAITNSHVADGRKKLKAETADGDRIDALVIGDDPSTDIAVLKLNSSELPFAEWGDSDGLRVGHLVIAMGSPMGLHATVCTGVVSALGRSMRGQDGRLIDSVVQHAAPINPGNSGGPLVDSHSRIVGINTAIIPMAQGIGFAVPSNTAKWVTDEILAHGQVRRRLLGIVATTVRLPKAVVRSHDLFAAQAVRVVEVARNGLADRCGIRVDDLIVAINDRITSNIDEVHRLLSTIPASVPIELTIVREQRKLEIVVT